MAKTETIHHPTLRRTVTLPASTARVLKQRSGWQDGALPDVDPPAGNASADEWRKYATDVLQLDVADDASRDDIKQLVAAHQDA